MTLISFGVKLRKLIYSDDFTYDYSYTDDELPEDNDSSDESGYMDDCSDNYSDDDYSYTDDELPEDNNSSNEHIDNTEPTPMNFVT